MHPCDYIPRLYTFSTTGLEDQGGSPHDIFSAMFGGVHRGSKKGKDVLFKFVLGLEDLYNGHPTPHTRFSLTFTCVCVYRCKQATAVDQNYMLHDLQRVYIRHFIQFIFLKTGKTNHQLQT